ncbi:hypothetical protein S225a_06920 [Candidatus Brocadiaceae bacterium S225]|uniref:Uncharacterized protein n=1 Tax=Candidatus Scalindua brodae TaxID=237368 RepID=A0A0B0ENK4_9BACT|nr:MAG: hypothetical protein SCABRO_01573 [Candidatus Scalindua brodae]TWU36413.1 hypothetical protein S225a_06920 [Candidatus Brocadiaceae bacterium S225]
MKILTGSFQPQRLTAGWSALSCEVPLNMGTGLKKENRKLQYSYNKHSAIQADR